MATLQKTLDNINFAYWVEKHESDDKVRLRRTKSGLLVYEGFLYPLAIIDYITQGKHDKLKGILPDNILEQRLTDISFNEMYEGYRLLGGQQEIGPWRARNHRDRQECVRREVLSEYIEQRLQRYRTVQTGVDRFINVEFNPEISRRKGRRRT